MANIITVNKDGFIEVKVVGDQTGESVAAMGEEVKRHLAQKGQRPIILDDITKLGKTDIPARQTVNHLAKTLPFERVAMYGDGSTLMRVGTNLLLKAIGMGDKIRYFENRQEAIDWLTHR
jgi:hypothetical protein